MMILLSFLALIPRIVLGYWIINWIWKTTEKKHLLIKVFISGPLGFGISSMFAFLWIWVGFRLFDYILIEGIIVASLTLGALIKCRAQLITFPGSFLSIDQTLMPWLLFLGFIGLFFAIELTITALRYPHGRFDAWMQWNVAARFIYLGGSHWQGTFLRSLGHPDYPLFLGMTNAITWSITKKAEIWGPIAFHFSISCFMAGLFLSLVHTFMGFKQAVLATLMLLSQPITAAISMNQFADTLFAYFLLAIGGLAILYLSLREKGLAVIAGILAGLACWTKNEGMILVLNYTIVWIVIGIAGDWQGFKKYLTGLAFPLLIVILFKFFLAPKSDLVSDLGQTLEKIQDIDRYVLILSKAGRALWGIGEGPLNLIGLLLIYFIIVGRTKLTPPGTWFIVLMIFLQWSAYFGTYLVTPYPLEWHVDTSINRVLFHAVPLILFWVFLFIKTPQELQPSIESE